MTSASTGTTTRCSWTRPPARTCCWAATAGSTSRGTGGSPGGSSNNIPLTQFYAISLDLEFPYNIYGGAQDTHSWVGPSATRNQAGILNGDWKQTNFGDGMDQEAVPGEPAVALASSQNGNIVRLDTATGNRTTVRPFPAEDEDRYRFHWLSPMGASPALPGAGVLRRQPPVPVR